LKQKFFQSCAVAALMLVVPAFAAAQGRGRGPAAPPRPAREAAPFDPTGYWVSIIVDEWRFRVTPQKGDIPYLPLNAEARRVANSWDPAKDEADGNQCKAYGAVGVMQRPGRLHITWDDDNTLRIEADAGTQTRLLHFGPTPGQRGEPAWQGYSTAQWQTQGRGMINLGYPGGEANQSAPVRSGSLRAITTNMLPGYIRKNGVPYSANAVLNEYFNLLTGGNGESYLIDVAMVDDPIYLNQPFVRSYTFKKQPDASGWEPTPCWPK
jgi:hypothetical protein